MASQAPVYRIARPCSALAGGKDRVNPASHRAPRDRALPGGQAHFHEFPEMSHWLVGEPEAQDVAKFTLQWLERARHRARSR